MRVWPRIEQGTGTDVDDHEGHPHDAAVYTSDDELRAVAVPFVTEGLARGEPVLISLPPLAAQLVVSVLPDGADGVTVVRHDELYRRPALSVEALRGLVAGLRTSDAIRVRMLGAPPMPAPAGSWQQWARFESFLTAALGASPAWSLCAYDGRVASPDVLDEVRRTHRHLVDPASGRGENPAYVARESYLRESLHREHPVDGPPPVVTVTDPAPHEVRRLVERVAAGTRLGVDERLDLVTAVSEVTTNAHHHGRSPVVVRIWTDADHVTVRVRDAGPGPADPGVGLTRADREPGAGGMGLWLANLLCAEVSMAVDHEGFEVRLTALADPAA